MKKYLLFSAGPSTSNNHDPSSTPSSNSTTSPTDEIAHEKLEMTPLGSSTPTPPTSNGVLR